MFYFISSRKCYSMLLMTYKNETTENGPKQIRKSQRWVRRVIEIMYIFLSCSVRISSPAEAIEHRAFANDVISDKRFRLLQHISNGRHPSKFRVLGEKEHIERKLLNAWTHLDYSESIKLPINLEGKESCPKDVFECSNKSKPIKIRFMTVRSKFRYVKLLPNLIFVLHRK